MVVKIACWLVKPFKFTMFGVLCNSDLTHNHILVKSSEIATENHKKIVQSYVCDGKCMIRQEGWKETTRFKQWIFNFDDDWYVGEEENAGVSCLAMIDLNNDLIRIEEVGSSATSTVPVA